MFVGVKGGCGVGEEVVKPEMLTGLTGHLPQICTK